MRHKYETRGITLSRTSLGEANAFVTFLTPDLGVVRVRAQSLRVPGAKLASALTTFAESSLMLVRGEEGWRIAGAVLEENWFKRLQRAEPRRKAGRICGLLLRLVAGEMRDSSLFPIVRGLFKALSKLPEDTHEAAEVLAALRIIAVLGFDGGEIPGEASHCTPSLLQVATLNRTGYIARINHGIAASGL